MDHLNTAGFELVGCRMLSLTHQQAEYFTQHIYQQANSQLLSCLTSGPSVVLALQRDSAVLAFDSYLGTSYDKLSILSRYGADILRPADIHMASSMLTLFFSKLTASSCVQVMSCRQELGVK
jgi:nucleoside diphosphate kinase